MTLNAVLFGSIGTLVETSELQRQAFNLAFQEAGLTWSWSPELYLSLLSHPGGRNRIEHYAQLSNTEVDSDALHTRKTEIFSSMMEEDGLQLRPGVKQIISRAKAVGARLGFVSTTSAQNIDAMFAGLQGELLPEDFDFIGNRDLVSSVKPASDIYDFALQELGTSARHSVAIEDTETSLLSAVSAGVPCIAFPGAFAMQQSFNEAVFITRVLYWQLIEKAALDTATPLAS